MSDCIGNSSRFSPLVTGGRNVLLLSVAKTAAVGWRLSSGGIRNSNIKTATIRPEAQQPKDNNNMLTYGGEVFFEHAGDELEGRRLNHLQQIRAQSVSILLQKPCITLMTTNK